MHHAAFRSGFHLSAGRLISSAAAQPDAAAHAASGRCAKDALGAAGRRALRIHSPGLDASLLDHAPGALPDAHS